MIASSFERAGCLLVAAMVGLVGLAPSIVGGDAVDEAPAVVMSDRDASCPSPTEGLAPRSGYLGGGAAVRFLGGRLGDVAARYGRTAAQLRDLFRSDPSLRTDPDGHLSSVEPPLPRDRELDEGAASFPLENTFLLNSRPGSKRTIFLDFDGAVVSGTAWNDNTGLPDDFYCGWSLDNDYADFNEAERGRVQSIWQRVAEDFAPFDVNVTTQDPGFEAIDRATASDDAYGTQVLISSDDTAHLHICNSSCGGMAGIGVFNDFKDPSVSDSHHAYWQPAWVFGYSAGAKFIAELASHEAGHNLGLWHDGRTRRGSLDETYYGGHGAWAPIMGSGLGRPLVQWSRGEYADANNREDDFTVMADHGLALIADEAPADSLDAPRLPAAAQGYISTRGDADTFALGDCAGPIEVSASPAPMSPNLDIRLELLDESGNVLQADNPPTSYERGDLIFGLDAGIQAVLPHGEYYARVDGVRFADPSTTGYSDYGSLGAYTITATGCDDEPSTPARPEAVTATSAPDGRSITLTWEAPDDDGGAPVEAYVLTKSDVTGPQEQAEVGGQDSTFTWTGLPGRMYWFTVRARNSAGEGPAEVVSIETPVVLPSGPTGVTATATADGRSATVSWQEPDDDGGAPLEAYVLTRTGVTEPLVTGGDARQFTWTGLTPGAVYVFGVAARTKAGVGQGASITMLMPSPTPLGPVVEDTTAPTVRFVVRPRRSAGRVVRFKVRANESGVLFEYRLDARTWKQCAAATRLKGLRFGTHRLRVRAIDPAGNVSPVIRARFATARHRRL